ncbi:ribonuclease 3 [Cydia strobilella]|uniref:ribonuclease 3 n=1 Tax=Cydia strobilella TaxID=1100964 RepID=UPI0030045149
MSIPPVNYSVPPPRLNMPPPAVPPMSMPPPSAPPLSVPPPSAPPMSVPPPSAPPPVAPPLSMPPPTGPPLPVPPPTAPPLSVPPPSVPPLGQLSMPPPQLFQHPPPYSRPLPSMDKPPPLPITNLPPLNVPPPSVTAFPPPAVPPQFPPPTGAAFHSPDFSNPPPTLKDKLVNPNQSKSVKQDTPTTSKVSDRAYYDSKIHSSSSRSRYDSPPRHRDKSHDRERDYREGSHRKSSPTYSSSSYSRSRHSRSPSRQSHRDRDDYRERDRHRESSRDRYGESSHRDRELEKERYYREKYEREKMRYEHERRHSPSHHRESSHSRRSPSRYSHRSPSRHSGRSPSRHSHRSPSRHSHRSPSRYSHRSPSRHSHRSPSRYSHQSPNRHSLRSPSRDSRYRSHARDVSPRSRHEALPKKPLTDREKILEEYRKNYCQTSEDLIEKIEKWSKEKQEEEETPKMWYRSSPAELYYIPIEGSVKQTPKLQKICDAFFTKVIERGRKARPEVDELPPLKAPKAKMCKHRLDEKSSSSSSSESEESLDEDGLQGYTDRIMVELQRKQSHPRRLHPEMWFNNTGEMNGGPLCRCSARARRHGMRHGVYAGEGSFPRCRPDHSNLDKLYHYRITVSPPTNFLIKAPTIIGHDEHEFLFSGFSMFSHYKLAKLPTCKVIRFNIEYTILYVEEPAPQNFTVRELDLFEDFLFMELLELVDLDLGKATENSCSQFHFMPRFVRFLPEGGCEVLSMCEVLKYLLDQSGLLIPPKDLENFHSMDHYTWQKFVDRIKGMIVTYPGKKPCSVRVDQLDRSPPVGAKDTKPKSFYPEIVHFGIRPPQLSYAGNPEYQKAWRYYVKYRHLIANMAKPSFKERQKLTAKEAKLQEMRTQSKMKRDVTVAISSEGFHTTGLMCDIVQHAMLIPVLVRHLRFHKSLDSLEEKMGYVFKQRALLQTALTHPSYRENFGTNPDHARNSLTNCGIRQPEYGDRRIHYTRKKGIVTLINIMSRFGKHSETESEIKHNERLEFLGDAVVEFLSSIHLFRMFPGLAEGGLATYRASIVQNQHLAKLAKNIELEQFMLYAHGSDLCRDVVMRHAMANCFEALMGALFLDGALQVSDRVFSLALWYNKSELLEVWNKERAHPLQEQEPLGDRKYIRDFKFLQKLTEFEDSIGVQFKHIRLLARAFTDRSVGFTHLTLGSNQRLEFLGDTVLQLVVSDRLYRHFPDHHEGHLSLLRSSLVNNRTQAMVCDDLNMSEYAIYNNPKAKPTTKKHKADLLEAFLGALYIDKNLDYCQAFCNACLFPRLQEFILNQDWNDPKSKLQQCCLTLRSMEGGEPDIPLYKVIECLGPTNTRVYTVGVYFRGARLAAARGHSIQEAEMNAAEQALAQAHELFPQLDHQKKVIAKSMKRKKRSDSPQESAASHKRKRLEDRVPKAYRLDKQSDSESEDISSALSLSEDEEKSEPKSDDDSGLDSDAESISQDKLENVQVSSLVSDMEKIKEDLIRRNEYDKLKEKCRQSDSDEE